MRCYLALVLLLVVPACGQIRRGTAQVCYSNFHNFGCIPVDGGLLYAWAMSNVGGSTCTAGNNLVKNDASFTGSIVTTANCGGSSPPSLSATGLTVVANGNMIIQANPDFSTGFTIASVYKPTAVNTTNYCGMLNVNYPTDTTYQYQGNRVDLSATGDFGFLYDNSGTVQAFSTAGSTVSAGSWTTTAVAYKSATAGSARLWKDNAPIAGSWTIGTGTAALPAVQVDSGVGANHEGTGPCIGTVGFVIGMDHRANDIIAGLIYRAFYKTMQFRGVAVP